MDEIKQKKTAGRVTKRHESKPNFIEQFWPKREKKTKLDSAIRNSNESSSKRANEAVELFEFSTTPQTAPINA